jgi:multidrug efflux pump subunit AcrB
MRDALLISGALIFFILAALFRSLLDPLVVMFAIPFGAIGVVFGHMLFGYNLQFLSVIGFLALTGIVVNDSLILVNFAKRLRREGMSRVEAMIEAVRVRVRPILLTSITTFLGISPLIFFATGQTAFLSPMAVSLGFGLLFATAVILVAIPCFYLIADDLRERARATVRARFPVRGDELE